uniref:(northern house mosquito) hypothetical protein n=1 Tax=Culex pipiens TaxID=7175 RepID=A0A8D8D7H5_CULPI
MSRCKSRRRCWRRAILLLSSAVLVVAADLDRRPWRVKDSSDFGATGTWNSTSVRNQECFARSTQIHSHTYTHTDYFDRVYYLSLEVERVQLANFANDTSNFFLSTLCKTTKSHA